MIKRTILYVFLFCYPLQAMFGQSVQGSQGESKVPNLPFIDSKTLSFGFLIGFNMMDYRVVHRKTENLAPGVERRYAEVVNLNPGLNLGLVANLRINNRLYFRLLPGISFGQRDLLFVDDNGNIDEFPLEIKSTYLECPALIRFYGDRMTNARPYFVGGVNPRFDLAKSRKDGILIRPLDVYAEFGVGIVSYFSTFRLSSELRTSIGLTNILDPAGIGTADDMFYTSVINQLFSRIFTLTFYFE
jgi:hypothetical protein